MTTRLSSGYRFPQKADYASRDLLNVDSLKGEDGKKTWQIVFDRNPVIISSNADKTVFDFSAASTEFKLYIDGNDVTDNASDYLFSYSDFNPTFAWDIEYSELHPWGGSKITLTDILVSETPDDITFIHFQGEFFLKPEDMEDSQRITFEYYIPVVIIKQQDLVIDDSIIDTDNLEVNTGKISTKLLKKGSGTSSLQQLYSYARANRSAAFNYSDIPSGAVGSAAVGRSNPKNSCSFGFGTEDHSGELVTFQEVWATDESDVKPLQGLYGTADLTIANTDSGVVFVDIELFVVSKNVVHDGFYRKRFVVYSRNNSVIYQDDISESGDYSSKFGTNPSVSVSLAGTGIMSINVNPPASASEDQALARIFIHSPKEVPDPGVTPP